MTVRVLAVRRLVYLTPRTFVIQLDLGGVPFPFAAGQAVMAGRHGSPLRRPYSIAASPGEAARDGAIELLVQADDSGSPDPHLEQAPAGTQVDVEGPFGSFGLPRLDDRPLLLVAGGTGIAPLRSMLIDALSGAEPPRATLIYSARSAAEFAFREELDALARDGKLRLFLTVTRPDDIGWDGRRGRFDAALLAEALPSREALCVVCGPPAMVDEATRMLRDLGVPGERVLMEEF